MILCFTIEEENVRITDSSTTDLSLTDGKSQSGGDMYR